MNTIIIKKLTNEQINEQGIKQWAIWEKEVSMFPWTYEDTEACYFIEGVVSVETAEGTYEIKKGDYVEFPKGLSCKWHIKEHVKKYYNFK